MGWGGWGYFPKSRPREAKGGIKAQSKKGSLKWWAKRWIEVIESYDIGARLSRGRSYARSGQVLSIDVGKGTVSAKVQGSRPNPYAVTIDVKALGKAEWTKVAEAVSSRAVFATKLLAGEMPLELESVFTEAGVTLFPARYQDLKTDCSCPDWSNPCKHVAAVFYLLGEEFDRDPFLILRMRGMVREEFIALLGEGVPRAAAAKQELPLEPLPEAHSVYWRVPAGIPDGLAGDPPVGVIGAALARRCGNFPFWRGGQPLVNFLDGVYGRASSKASGLL